jgi:hypothetical protein
MSTFIDVAKKMAEAWGRKDEAAEFMKRCPFESTSENCEVIVEGKTLVHLFTLGGPLRIKCAKLG